MGQDASILGADDDLQTLLEVALACANQILWKWRIPTGRLKTYSSRTCIIGYDRLQLDPTYAFWIDAVHPEDRETVESSLQEHFSGKSEYWGREHRYRDPHGDYKWVMNAGKVVRFSEDGKPLKMIGITQRTHERKELELAYLRTNSELSGLIKERDEFFRHASHDMKNALQGVLGIADLIREEASPQDRDLLKIVETSLSQSYALAEKLHDLALGKLVPVRESSICLEAFLQELHRFHLRRAEGKGLRLTCGCNFTGGGKVDTDPVTLRRILDNLVGNAIKFTESGTIEVNVVVDPESGDVQFWVRDSGPGIPVEKHDELFKPFSRLSNHSEGSGLGLSICRSLAESLGGEVFYKPNVPRGSVFFLKLPQAFSHHLP